jgi:hypothetical protein
VQFGKVLQPVPVRGGQDDVRLEDRCIARIEAERVDADAADVPAADQPLGRLGSEAGEVEAALGVFSAVGRAVAHE